MHKRLFLQVGDLVEHVRYPHWGQGKVVQEQHSSLAGGFCMVRVLFADEVERTFINDLDNECCCYFSGVRIL